ncbi:MAG: GerMN domain-containing protein [Lachnospiraceae bacterium]|nr:GerMN domain-containing protein [Lachnospiraceae bacterium]MDD3616301.1 GerMN domain-containing protein [Lachnospiraceae bacterium]
MKKNQSYMGLLVLLCIGFLMGLGGCAGQSHQEEAQYAIYYLNNSGMTLKTRNYKPDTEDSEKVRDELASQLQEIPVNDGQRLLPEDVTINSLNLQDTTLTIDFSDTYSKMEKAREILVRAGVVKTFCQMSEVESVIFLVNGQELTDSSGNITGSMGINDFVENSGKEINSYVYSNLTLYFETADATQLVPVEKKVYYSSNVPIERVVVEQLLKGTTEETMRSTMPADTSILSVTIADNICYVNFDSKFKDNLTPNNAKLTVYSLVNSIVDNCHVQSVQIAINGDVNQDLADDLSLNQLFQKDRSFIKGADADD